MSQMFTGVGNAQGFLVKLVVYSATVVTNDFIKNCLIYPLKNWEKQ